MAQHARKAGKSGSQICSVFCAKPATDLLHHLLILLDVDALQRASFSTGTDALAACSLCFCDKVDGFDILLGSGVKVYLFQFVSCHAQSIQLKPRPCCLLKYELEASNLAVSSVGVCIGLVT